MDKNQFLQSKLPKPGYVLRITGTHHSNRNGCTLELKKNGITEEIEGTFGIYELLKEIKKTHKLESEEKDKIISAVIWQDDFPEKPSIHGDF